MSLQTINWREQAFDFAKKHNSNREMVIQLVELSMKRGAEIAVDEIFQMMREANLNITKKRLASAPHQEIKHPINVETL